MADINSSLPVRTETNGDVAAKIVDGTVSSQALGVDASGKITTKMNDGAGNAVTSQVNGSQRALDVGINVAGVQIDPRQIRTLTGTDIVTANQGTPNSIANGWPVKPTDGTNSQQYLATGEAKVSVTQPIAVGTNSIGRVRLQDGAANDITSSAAGATRPLDVALRDGAGDLYSGSNPLPVAVSKNNPGTETNNFNTAASIAGGASSNHTYTSLNNFLLTQVEGSASGRAKFEIQVESGVATNTYNTVCVMFNSTSDPNISLHLEAPILVATGVRVRVIRTNRDLTAQDVYSTICGQEG